MNIYVGNLSNEVTDQDLREAFETFGTVESATVIRDRFTGESRGFGFVEIPSDEDAQKAIDDLDGKELKGKSIVVNKARPRSENRRSGNRQGGSWRF